MALTVRYRGPDGRFTRPTGRKKLRKEFYDTETHELKRTGQTRRYRAPRADEQARELGIKFRTRVEDRRKGETLNDFITRTSTMRKLSRKQFARVHVSLTDPRTGRRVTFTKTVKLATRGKNLPKQNRAILLRTIQAGVVPLGFRFSPKKFRGIGADKHIRQRERQLPTARNVVIRIEANV